MHLLFVLKTKRNKCVIKVFNGRMEVFLVTFVLRSKKRKCDINVFDERKSNFLKRFFGGYIF